jgi:hypothetical protein
VAALGNREVNASNYTHNCFDSHINEMDELCLCMFNNGKFNTLNIACMDYFDVNGSSNYTNDSKVYIDQSIPCFNTGNVCTIFVDSRIDGADVGLSADFTSHINSTDFGFCPATIPEIYCGPAGQMVGGVSELLWLAELLRDNGLKNYVAKIHPLNTHIDVHCMLQLAEGYYDMQALDSLELGFPLDMRMVDFTPCKDSKNHPSADNFFEHVRDYLQDELKQGAIIGPYNINEFDNIHISPLMSRPKDITKRRIIVDLSYPYSYGSSVNSVTSTETSLDISYTLKLPTVDTIGSEILKGNSNVKLYKIDLARAFRQTLTRLTYLIWD